MNELEGPVMASTGGTGVSGVALATELTEAFGLAGVTGAGKTGRAGLECPAINRLVARGSLTVSVRVKRQERARTRVLSQATVLENAEGRTSQETGRGAGSWNMAVDGRPAEVNLGGRNKAYRCTAEKSRQHNRVNRKLYENTNDWDGDECEHKGNNRGTWERTADKHRGLGRLWR